jgi:hypothetical protein
VSIIRDIILKKEANEVGSIVAAVLSWLKFNKLTIINGTVHVDCGFTGRLRWLFFFRMRRETSLFLEYVDLKISFKKATL